MARRFIEVKKTREGRLEKKTVFLFYSESALSEEAAALLHESGILVLVRWQARQERPHSTTLDCTQRSDPGAGPGVEP